MAETSARLQASPPEAAWEGHAGPVLDSVKGFDVIACGRCAFRHAIPLPAPEVLRSAYQEDYYSVEKPLYLEHLREDLPWWTLVHTERYESFERLLSPHRRRVLDVGAGSGYFLKVGLERGWTCLGIEPSTQAAAHARSLGIDVMERFLTEEVAADLGTFDVVHMHEVLEHIPDPLAMLRTAAGLVAPGGLLCVVVPNDYNPLQVALRSIEGYAPWWVAPPHHLNYFDVASLAALVERANFEVVESTTTFPIEVFLLMGDNYVGNDVLGRAVHAKRKRLELALAKGGLGDLKQKLYRALAWQGIGREAVIVARSPDAGSQGL